MELLKKVKNKGGEARMVLVGGSSGSTAASGASQSRPRPILSKVLGKVPHTGSSAEEGGAVVSGSEALGDRMRARLDSVESAIGLRFSQRQLLREALTHRSYLNEAAGHDRESNERLEFLGDSVLGLIVTTYLYDRFPGVSEGELTNLRSALVRTETLAEFARRLNLGSNLLVGKGEELNRGRHRPAGLACAFEALLGAVYIDKGYEAASCLALRFVAPALEAVLELRLHRNGKSTLQEVVQAQRQQTPSYHVVAESGPDHRKSFTVEVRVGDDVLGRGSASNKRSAEQQAAENALATLEIEV